jgi:ABC-2 type transport system ATP-binding protein
MIRFEGVTKSFGGVRAIDGLSLDVPAGAVTAVAGADGAGKSTLLRAAVGLVRIDGGRILFDGTPVDAGFRDVRRAAGYMPEKSALYPDLSVGETLRFVADIHGLPRARRRRLIEDLLAWSALAPFSGRSVAALSGGMRQKLALCAALIPGPRILVLDEPTTGLDPNSRRDVARLIVGLKAEGKAVLMSTSNLADAETADALLYLKEGRAVLQGGVAGLKAGRPARILRLRPSGSALDLLPEILADPRLRAAVIVRGNALYCREEDAGLLDDVAFLAKEPLPPTLEDICLFAERDRAEAPRP